jgi:uncharacterized protein YggE
METKTVFLGTTVVLLVALAGLLGAYFTGAPEGQPTPSLNQISTEQKNTISVTATGIVSVQPDRAKIQMSVITEGDTAELASTRNSDKFNALLQGLLDSGIPQDQIETTQYNIYPVYDYSDRTPQLTGYRAQHSVMVTVISTQGDGLGKIAGQIIDTSISAGVNQIDSIQFTISDDMIHGLRNEALKEAVLDAREKADVMAEALGVTITAVNQVSESSSIPVVRDLAPSISEGAKSATELVPGELKVSASVNIVYEIGQ